MYLLPLHTECIENQEGRFAWGGKWVWACDREKVKLCFARRDASSMFAELAKSQEVREGE